MDYHKKMLEINRDFRLLAPKFAELVSAALAVCAEQGLEVYLFEGWRSPQRQDQLASKKKSTRAGAWQSYHQYGIAGDIAYKVRGKWSWEGDFDKPEGIFKSFGLETISWEQGHFQLTNGVTWQEAKAITQESGVQGLWIALGLA